MGSGYSMTIHTCANCGKQTFFAMGCSTWGHNQMCCSRACGVRYGQKLRAGMLPVYDEQADRVLALRIEIKRLTHLMKV